MEGAMILLLFAAIVIAILQLRKPKTTKEKVYETISEFSGLGVEELSDNAKLYELGADTHQKTRTLRKRIERKTGKMVDFSHYMAIGLLAELTEKAQPKKGPNGRRFHT
jgi:hypothetical protein